MAKNIIIVGLITILVKAISFYKDALLAKEFGLSDILDTFLIALLVPSLFYGVFIGSYSSVFIPNYTAELKDNNNKSSFQSASFIITFLCSAFFILVSIILSDIYLENFFTNHTPQYYALIKSQLYIILPSLIFWGFSSILNGLLNIDNEFTFATLETLLVPLSIIICLLFFKVELGQNVLAYGTLIGSFIGFLFLTTVAYQRGILSLAVPDFRSKNIILLFKQLPAKLTSSILNGINPLIDQYFSAQLAIGSIAALSFGIKIPMLIIGVVGMALGNVLLPFFSRKALQNLEETSRNLKRILKLTFIGTVLITLILILMSKPIVSILFERDAFKASDTVIVSRIQVMYLLQIPFYITGIIMVRFLTAINRNGFMAFASALSLILNIVLNIILIKSMEVYGLALATSIVSLVNTVILYFYINNLKIKNV